MDNDPIKVRSDSVFRGVGFLPVNGLGDIKVEQSLHRHFSGVQYQHTVSLELPTPQRGSSGWRQ